jgi:hypothetical protein
MWAWVKGLRDSALFNEIPLSRRWRFATPFFLFVAIATLTMYRELGRLLHATHLPGAGSYGPESLANVGFHAPDSSGPALVIKTWHEAEPAHATSPGDLLGWALVIDSVFVFAYCLLLALALMRIGSALRRVYRNNALLAELEARRARFTIATGGPPVVDPVKRLVNTFRLLVVIGLLTVPLVGILDLLENLFTWLTYTDPDTWFWPLWTFSALKTILVLLVLAALTIAALAWLSFYWPSRQRAFATLVAMRAQLVLAAAFVLLVLFDPTGQVVDSARSWEQRWFQLIAALALGLLFSFLLTIDARKLLRLASDPFWPQTGYDARAPAVLIVAGMLVFAIGYFANREWDVGQGLMVLAGILFAVGFLSLFVARLPPDEPVALWSAQRPTALLAVLPAVTLGVVTLRASFSEIAYAAHDEYSWLVAVALLYILAGWLLYPALKGWTAPDWAQLVARVAAGAVALGFFIATIWAPWLFGSAVGMVAVLVAFMIAAAIAFFGLGVVAEHVRPPQAFTLLRLRRIPIFLLLLLWAVLAAVIDRSGSYYDVRKIEPNTSEAACTTRQQDDRTEAARCHNWTAAEELAAWMKRNTRSVSGTPRPAVPLVFVATEGGGIRAAYWTAITLRCVFERIGASDCGGPTKRTGRAFAMSGVSGGALGLVTYDTHLAATPDDVHWPTDTLRHDFVGPVFAWALFVDLPLSFIRRGGGTDRAEVLERSWEREWSDTAGNPLGRGLYAQWLEHRLPLVFLNGTRVQDGCRFETSVVLTAVGSSVAPQPVTADDPLIRDCLALRLFEDTDKPPRLYVPPSERTTWMLGATTDLAPNLCPGEDVRLSTAALLAARFPYVAPSGKVEKCGGGSPANIVDGGYFENTGNATIVELWDSLRGLVTKHNANAGSTCVVPVLLEIDNHYRGAPGPAPAGRPWESSAPLQTLRAGRDARDAESRQAAALAFGQREFDGMSAHVGSEGDAIDRIAHIFPRAHPGAEAPLGWTLSDVATADLDDRLKDDNRAELKKIQKWFAPDLNCVGP